jgi:hypothetical protein
LAPGQAPALLQSLPTPQVRTPLRSCKPTDDSALTSALLFRSRCDRQQPCSSCSSRRQTCTYAENRAATLLPKPPPAAVPDMHDRLVQLERLVMSLMPDSANKPNPGANPDSSLRPGSGDRVKPADTLHSGTPMDGRSECGSMRVSVSELHYVGGDHWAAILDSIADLKDHFDREEQLRLANSPDLIQEDNGDGDGGDSLTRPRPPHALLLYGCRRPASRAEILAALPPKGVVDRYISRYFNRLDLVASCR